MGVEETQVLNAHGVLVTTRRVVCGGTTYSVANITSVGVSAVQDSVGWAASALIIGFLVALIGALAAMGPCAFMGICLIGAGTFGVARRKTTHVVTLRTAGGEAQAFASKSAAEVRDVAEAISTAMML